jgi:hypothetical protein
MSEFIGQESNKLNIKRDEMNNEEKRSLTKEKGDAIDPTSLLSKDLLNQINSLEEKDSGVKANNITDHLHLDKTQKESEENGEEDDYMLEIEKEMDKDIFGSEETDKSNVNIKQLNMSQNQGRFSQPVPYSQNIMNSNFSNPNDEMNSILNIGRFSYDCHPYQNNSDNLNGLFNNSFQNQLNFFNNSFTMNGKSGWVCAYCKNFNYESEYI